MKSWAWVVVLPLLASLASAESLGSAAKREKERREKQKEKQKTETTVIRDEDLAAGSAKGSKGTFNSGTGTAAAGRPAGEAAHPGAPAGTPGATVTEVDSRRIEARRRLEASYESIHQAAYALWQAVNEYEQCGGGTRVSNEPSSCDTLLGRIGTLAMTVGAGMEDAEDAARQGWLSPGEVRDARQRHGMDDTYWDGLVALVRKYRR
jgi:hypothetical protein